MFSMMWLLNRLSALAAAHAQELSEVHAAVMSLLIVAWTWPWVARLAHRMPRKAEIEWVRLWRCPRCSTMNYQTYASCLHCEYHLKLGFWRRRMPTLLSAKAARELERLATRYAGVGWLIFYGITGAVCWKLQLYRFPQLPLIELAASGTVLLLLLGLWYLRRAFRLRRKSPLAIVMDGAVGVLVLYLAGFSLWLWAAASHDFALASRLAQAYRWIPNSSTASPQQGAQGSKDQQRQTESTNHRGAGGGVKLIGPVHSN